MRIMYLGVDTGIRGNYYTTSLKPTLSRLQMSSATLHLGSPRECEKFVLQAFTWTPKSM